MKIGILTFHLPTNFGANLQAFSSVNYYTSRGHEVKVINYAREEDLRNPRHVSKVQLNAHCDFVERRLPLTKRATNSVELSKIVEEEHFDLIIIGADAVWRAPKDDNIYFAQWLFEDKAIDNIPVVAISPAHMGKGFNGISTEKRDEIKKCLTKFKYIAVRDEWTRKVINDNLFDHEDFIDNINPDPVFLLNNFISDEWISYDIEPKSYMLLTLPHNWALGKAGFVRRIWFKQLKKRVHHKGIKIVELPLPEGTSGLSFDYTVSYPIDPIQWYLWLKNAKYYCGLRFHSIVSCISAGTPFFSIDSYGSHSIKKKIAGLLGFYKYSSKDDYGSKIYSLLKDTKFEQYRVNSYIEGIAPGKLVHLLESVNTDDIIQLREKNISTFMTNVNEMFAIVSGKQIKIETLRDECTACFACANVCPQNAIAFNEKSDGFFYPNIDYSKCVQCRSCEKVCPQLGHEDYFSMKKAYYGFSRSSDVRTSSSSGGLFSEIAYRVLSKGGVVYGAAFEYEPTLMLKCMSTEQTSIEALKKSKYVQCYVGDSFRRIKRDLDFGKRVLYCSTPCQVDGLKSFLHRDYNNLTTVDFVCHGVPSMQMLKDHLSMIGMSHVQEIDFRPKHSGWVDDIVIKDNKKKYERHWSLDEDFGSFENCRNLRRSCYNCIYCNGNRAADITLADFWGYKDYNPKIYDKRGLSLVMVNTDKGIEVMEKMRVENKVSLTEIDNKYAAYAFSRKRQEDKRYNIQRRNVFLDDIAIYGYEEALKRNHLKVSNRRIMRYKVVSCVKSLLK